MTTPAEAWRCGFHTRSRAWANPIPSYWVIHIGSNCWSRGSCSARRSPAARSCRD